MNSTATTFESEVSQNKEQYLLTIGVLILISFQLFDAIFTLEGINRYGIVVEGNFLVRTVLIWLTPLYGMCFIKGVAISLCLLLYKTASTVPWITSVIYALNVLYFSAALVPWARVLF